MKVSSPDLAKNGLILPIIIQPLSADPANPDIEKENSRKFALFLMEEYDLDESTTLNAGIRWEHQAREYQGAGTSDRDDSAFSAREGSRDLNELWNISGNLSYSERTPIPPSFMRMVLTMPRKPMKLKSESQYGNSHWSGDYRPQNRGQGDRSVFRLPHEIQQLRFLGRKGGSASSLSRR